MDLIRRLRYSGYLDQLGITEHEPGEVFEKLIDHLASTTDWSRVSAASNTASGVSTASDSDRISGVSTGSGSDRVSGVSTGSGSDRVKGSKQATKKKAAKKPSKSKSKKSQPEPDEVIAESVKLHYIIDRRDFLDKVKSVYASYAA